MNADGRLRQALLFMGCKPWHIAEIMAELQASGLKESELPGDVSLESVLKQFNYWSAERQLMEFRLAQRVVIKRDLPICILIGGTSGCGKSTLASLLASRIGVNTVVSTDHIRQLLRSQLSREEAPHLWSSSYNASLSQQSHGQYNNISPSAQVYAGYEHQTEYIKSHVLALCRSFMARRESLIVEGVHLSVEVIRTIMMELTHCIPFLLYISNQTKHTERLAIRAKYMTLEPRKNRYVKHFNNIRIIQDVLCTKADCSLIPKIDNTNIDKSLAFIHRTIFEYLYRCSYTQDSGSDRLCSGNDRNLAVLHEIYGKVRENYHWSSKEMLQHIRERQLFKRQQLQQKSLTALEFESMSPPGAGDTEHFLRLATTDEEEEAADEHERILMCLDNLNWGSLGS